MKKNAFILALCMAFAIAPQSLTASAKSIGMPKPAPIFTPFFMNTTKNWQHHIKANFAYGTLPNVSNVPKSWKAVNKNVVTTPDFWLEVHGPIFSKYFFGSLPEIYPYFDYFRAWWPLSFPTSTDDGPVLVELGQWYDNSEEITGLNVIYQSGENIPTAIPLPFDDHPTYAYLIWFAFKSNDQGKKDLIAYYLQRLEFFTDGCQQKDIPLDFWNTHPIFEDYTTGEVYLTIQ